MISFKGVQFPKNVILHAVYFYLHGTVSYWDLKEILAKRGVVVDPSTLNRRVVKYALLGPSQRKVGRNGLQLPGGWMRPT